MSHHPGTVVIVGAGFAGLGCARALAKHDDVHVTLIDRNDYHQFQPLLYQVATAQLARARCRVLAPRSLPLPPQRGGRRRRGRVGRPADPDRVPGRRADFSGDALVLAAGARARFFKTPGAAEHSFPLYTVEQAGRLRERIIEVFDAANAIRR